MLLHSLGLKCPKCKRGKLFKNANPYKYNGYFEMFSNCKVCNQDFVIEVGFYYGAMYVSYGINIILMSLIYLLEYMFDFFTIINFLLIYLLASLISLPYLYKLSRAIWLSLMVTFSNTK